MELPRPTMDLMTPSQRQAVAARGNILVMAGAGTGKTKTLIARCLNFLEGENASLDELLIVTFTEAAAAEMRQRLRHELEKKAASEPAEEHWLRQLALFDTAHIGTLHSFCVRLVREHFYELGLDPQFSILDEIQARLLADATLDEQFQGHYERKTDFSAAVLAFIQIYGGGRDDKIRSLVLRMHQYAQTRPDAGPWLADQLAAFQVAAPAHWQKWLQTALENWRAEWVPQLKQLMADNVKAGELLTQLERWPSSFDRSLVGNILTEIIGADDTWPKGKKGKLRPPLEKLFESAGFLATLTVVSSGQDPLGEDWGWVRDHMTALLKLTAEFTNSYAARKRSDGVLDFQDLEQFALRLLWNFSMQKTTPIAERWQQKLRLVLVDEYQDINAAQDKIITALARTGTAANRFLVGDVKQSIYRFRLADPGIFRAYAHDWQPPRGQTIPLTDNFRSREGLLDFVNSVFQLVLRPEIGGVAYEADARLKFGAPGLRAALSVTADPAPCVELLIRHKSKNDESLASDEQKFSDLEDSQKEARLAAGRLKQLMEAGHRIWDETTGGFRPVAWRDMTVLLRSPRHKSAAYIKEFEQAGVPLAVERGGFYECSEILDLLSLLQLLDNPLQDVPCLAVLRSPFVGLTLDQLAEIHLMACDQQFWTALNHAQIAGALTDPELTATLSRFLERFRVWRKLIRQSSLSQCLEAVLTETHYLEWLKSQPRGGQRAANVDCFLRFAQQFDQFQRQGLYRFLQFIEAQRKIEAEPEVPATAAENAVRLMSIHQSKGLEFPVVLIADLAKSFNEQDLNADIIFDEVYGLCPRVKPPHIPERYASLPHWLAKHHQRRELRGEELRLLYVAFTRARDTLILLASLSPTKWESTWLKPQSVTPQTIAAARSFADWLGLWFSQHAAQTSDTNGVIGSLQWRLIDENSLMISPAALAQASVPDNARGAPAGCQAETTTETASRIERILTWHYGFTAATQRRAKASVTELRHHATAWGEEAEPVFIHWHSSSPRQKLAAAEVGTAHHTFLQQVAWENTGSLAALRGEAERLMQKGLLSAEEKEALNLAALAGFFASPLGQNVRAQAEHVRRELPFTANFTPAEIAQIIGSPVEAGLADEIMVVQGVADLVVRLPQETWLVDFKTDAIRPSALPGKIRLYTPQIRLYARALEKIYPGTTVRGWLHFLALNESVEINSL